MKCKWLKFMSLFQCFRDLFPALPACFLSLSAEGFSSLKQFDFHSLNELSRQFSIKSFVQSCFVLVKILSVRPSIHPFLSLSVLKDFLNCILLNVFLAFIVSFYYCTSLDSNLNCSSVLSQKLLFHIFRCFIISII